ncbi:unnamed protein product, partial [Protopolystoma xenopodis]
MVPRDAHRHADVCILCFAHRRCKETLQPILTPGACSVHLSWIVCQHQRLPLVLWPRGTHLLSHRPDQSFLSLQTGLHPIFCRTPLSLFLSLSLFSSDHVHTLSVPVPARRQPLLLVGPPIFRSAHVPVPSSPVSYSNAPFWRPTDARKRGLSSMAVYRAHFSRFHEDFYADSLHTAHNLTPGYCSFSSELCHAEPSYPIAPFLHTDLPPAGQTDGLVGRGSTPSTACLAWASETTGFTQPRAQECADGADAAGDLFWHQLASGWPETRLTAVRRLHRL